jgi:plasmid stability protein
MPQPDASSFHVRLQPDLMKRLKVAAAENERSINAEISARLAGSFDLSDDDRQKAVNLLTQAVDLLTKGQPRRARKNG